LASPSSLVPANVPVVLEIGRTVVCVSAVKQLRNDRFPLPSDYDNEKKPLAQLDFVFMSADHGLYGYEIVYNGISLENIEKLNSQLVRNSGHPH
jgi:hypothetical protein